MSAGKVAHEIFARSVALDSLNFARKYDKLMSRHIRNILLVASLYDSFTFQDQGDVNDLLFDTASDDPTAMPRIVRVSSSEEALESLAQGNFDLVISLLRVAGLDVLPFLQTVKRVVPGIPVLLLATSESELKQIDERVGLIAHTSVNKRMSWEARNPADGVIWMWPFLWQGDVRLFTAMVKIVEDRLNVYSDISIEPEIRVILLVEDSVKFYSSYLPMLYTEIVRQQQTVMADGLTPTEKLIRRRARPRILLANTFEEATEIYSRFRDSLLCAIVDVAFPRNGVVSESAGVDFSRLVRTEMRDLPLLIQSRDIENARVATGVNARFIHKRSTSLLLDIREFLFQDLGFGPFRFKLPNGRVVAMANDLRSFTEVLATVSDVSLVLHAARNDFSTWLAARAEFQLASDLRAHHLSEFLTTNDLRQFLISKVVASRQMSSQGTIVNFNQSTFDGTTARFARLGSGSLGGKGRGLGFLHAVIDQNSALAEKFPGVRVYVPDTLILATDVFDEFMEQSRLYEIALRGNVSDNELQEAFLTDGRLPEKTIKDLQVFLERVRYPLAVRSSSLFEDTFQQPFAGVYQTHLIANNASDTSVRLHELCDAIKSVYASTFKREAKVYVEATNYRTEEMKMAVLIQRVEGSAHAGRFFYPSIAGIARAVNYYPAPGDRAEDGVCLAALGLGGGVVEGATCIRFAPGTALSFAKSPAVAEVSDRKQAQRHSDGAAPSTPRARRAARAQHQQKKTGSVIMPKTEAGFQREFLALDLAVPFTSKDERSNMINLPIDEAAKHNTLAPVGSWLHKSSGTLTPMPFETPRDHIAKSKRAAATASAPPAVVVAPPESLIARNVHGLRDQVDPISAIAHRFGGDQQQPQQLQQPQPQQGPQSPRQPKATDADEDLRAVVTLSGALASEDLALRAVLATLLDVGSHGFACPVEIEFAVTLSSDPEKPHQFAILQVRPMSNYRRDQHFGIDHLPSADVTIAASRHALGNGRMENIADVLYVSPAAFSQQQKDAATPNERSALMAAIAHEINEWNVWLARQKRPYLLIGPGRFGSKDTARGIPVSWQQISGVRCILETALPGMSDLTPSEGTHFFQNITSFGIGYLTVYTPEDGHVDYAWLQERSRVAPPPAEPAPATRFVQLASFDKPLEVVIDGLSACAVVMKPAHDFTSTVLQTNAFLELANLSAEPRASPQSKL